MLRNMTSRYVTVMVIAALTALLIALPGCNTVEGVGEDVSALGNAVDDGAEQTNVYEDNDGYDNQ